MAWVDITDAELDPESEIRDVTAIRSHYWRLRDNIDAWRQGLTGAPKIQSEAFDDDELSAAKFAYNSFNETLWTPGSVGQGALAGGAIHLGQFIASYTVYTATDEIADQTWQTKRVNVAGLNMLGYQSLGSSGYAASDYYRFGFVGVYADQAGSGPTDLTNALGDGGDSDESYLFLDVGPGKGTGLAQYNFAYLLVYQVDSSPPYVLGDYPAHFFLWSIPRGNRLDGLVAGPTPPWIYNGPTEVIPHRRENGTGAVPGRAWRAEPRLPHPRGIAARNREALRENAAERRRIAAELRRMADGLPIACAAVRAEVKAGRLPRREAREIISRTVEQVDLATAREVEQIEITPAFKNADIARVPTPYPEINRAVRRGQPLPAGKIAALLAPCDEVAADLAILHRDGGENIPRLIQEGYLEVGDPIGFDGLPPGVEYRRLGWRNSKTPAVTSPLED